MMADRRCFCTLLAGLWLALAAAEGVAGSGAVDIVTADKFHEVMEGEWMLEL